MFAIEMESKDDLQNDMLLMMLKRLLILNPHIQRANRVDHIWQKVSWCVREYNYLVESNFKTKHQVADYAEMLNKSPKHYLIYSKNTTKNHLYKLFKTARYLKHADYYATLTRVSKKSLTK
jgi:hypothetical protein